MAKSQVTSPSMLQRIRDESLEFARRTAKETFKEVTETLIPVAPLFETKGGHEPAQTQHEKIKSEVDPANKSTPLDFAKLQDKYNSQDKSSLDSLRHTYFQKVKSDEQQAINELRQEDQERKQKVMEEEQRQQRELQQANQGGPAESAAKTKSVLGKARPKAKIEVNETKPGKSSH